MTVCDQCGQIDMDSINEICFDCRQEAREEEGTCGNCGGEGFVEHDCGEDTCCCLNPEMNVECKFCDGTGEA